MPSQVVRERCIATADMRCSPAVDLEDHATIGPLPEPRMVAVSDVVSCMKECQAIVGDRLVGEVIECLDEYLLGLPIEV